MRAKGRRQKREDGDGGAENDPHEVAGAREALQCAVEAVTAAAERSELDLEALYAEMRWRLPLERAMAAANAYSLGRLGARELVVAHSDAEAAEMARLAASVDPDKHRGARERLEMQAEKVGSVERTSACPALLQVRAQTVEDPLEARRDSCGCAVPYGRNALGEHYAGYSTPLSYTRGKTPAEVFARMKRAIREDIRLRDARRIAALNEQERARKQQLQQMGYLSSEAEIEARFDYLLGRGSTGNDA